MDGQFAWSCKQVRSMSWGPASKNPSYVFPASASELVQVSPRSSRFSFFQSGCRSRSTLCKSKKYFYILKPQTQTFNLPRNFCCRVLYVYEQSFWYILDKFPPGFHHKIDNGGIFKTSKKVSVTGDINWKIFFFEFEKLCMRIFELKKRLLSVEFLSGLNIEHINNL